MTIWMDLDQPPTVPTIFGKLLSRELGISERLFNSLRYNGAFTVADALMLSDTVLMRTPYFGRKTLLEWHEWQHKKGLRP